MPYKITIADTSGKPIPNAMLRFVDTSVSTVASFSAPTGIVTITDADTGLLDNPSYDVIASATGYYDAKAPSLGLLQFSEFEFRLQRSVSGGAILLVAGAAVAALAYYKPKKKKKLRGVGDGAVAPMKTGLAPMTQALLAVGGLGLLAYIIFKGRQPNIDLPNFASAELDRLISQGEPPTITEEQAAGYAATIVSAADDCGTDEDAIWSVMLSLRNTADVLLLIKVYGIREYKGCFDGDYFGYHHRNLAETLTSELSSTWIGAINDLFKNRSINFSF